MLLGTIEPELDNGSFLAAMGVLGIGMGLIVSQLGNVVQSSVGDATAARPAACRTPPSSSAPRWARRCSARS